MAQITWRDVAAPDFTGAARGITDAGKLLSDTIGKVASGVETFDKAQGDKVSKALSFYIAQNPDAAALENGVLSGNLAGLDFANRHVQNAITAQLSPDKIDGLFNAERAQRAAVRGEEDAVRQQGEAITLFDQRRALDEFNPVLTKITNLHNAGDRAGALKLGETVPWSRIGFSKTQDFLDKGVSRDKAAFEDGLTRREDMVNTTALNLVERFRPQAGTPEELGFLIREEMRGHEDDPNFGLISARINELLGNQTGGAAPSVSGAVPGLAGSPPEAALGLTYGGGQLPANIQTVGDLIANKSSLLSTLGATPVGVYQINAGTWKEFGQKALGNDWQSKSLRDFANQDAVGKAIFESTGGDYKKLMGRWASLSEAQAKAIAKGPWEQARGVIAKGESSVDFATLQGSAVATQAASAVEGAAQDPTGIASRMLAAASVKGDLDTVARTAAKDFGMEGPAMSQTLQMIMNRGLGIKGPSYPNGIRLTPAQALEVFKESRRNQGVGGFLLGWADQDNAAGKGMRVKDKIIDEVIRTYASPQAIQQTVRDAERNRLQQANSAGLQTFIAAYDNYKRASTASMMNKDYNPALLQRAKTQLIAAAQTAQVSQGTLEMFLNPQYFGDTSLISKLQVGNDTNTRAATNAAPARVSAKQAEELLAKQARSGMNFSGF